jgi:hypothetical protein
MAPLRDGAWTVAGKAGGGVVRVRAAGGGRRPPGWGFESGTADLARRGKVECVRLRILLQYIVPARDRDSKMVIFLFLLGTPLVNYYDFI